MVFSYLYELMFKIIAIFLLLSLCYSRLTIIANQSDISQTCQNSPAWKINLCNLTCATCMSTDNNKCSSCDSAYFLQGEACKLSNTTSTSIYYYFSTLTNPIFTTKEIQKFYKSSTQNQLQVSNTVLICSNYSYSFQMLGLFSNAVHIQFEVSYQETMQSFIIKVNLLMLVNNSKCSVLYIADGNSYSNDYMFTSISEAQGNYFPSNNQFSPSYLSLPALSPLNARTMIQPLTIPVSIYASTLTIDFSCISPNGNQGNYWAISDVIVLAEQCNTCITTKLSNYISSVGYMVIYSLCAVFPLLLLLYFFIKCDNYRKEKNKRQMISGNQKDYIPIKAVDRIINNIKDKQKEEARQKNILHTTIKTKKFSHKQ